MANKECPFDKDSYSFIEQDPFNPGNTLEGEVSFLRDDLYGALWIRKVNGEKVDPYLIHGTPKLMFPFDKGGNYHFPSANEIRSYLKYDGTNIYAYRYHDKNGKEYRTYKVRVYPFLRSRFLTMWKKMLDRYPISKIFELNPNMNGFSFELYGNLNLHLIKYEIPLDIALLFGRDKENNIVPCDEIKTSVPKASLEQRITSDYVWHYEQIQKKLQDDLVLTDEKHPETDEPLYTGEEGNVWYIHNKRTNKWFMAKCKPDEIQKIHWEWAKSPIDKNSLRTTVINALEVNENLTVEVVEKMLEEEFTQGQIRNSNKRIKKLVNKYQLTVDLRNKVRIIIDKENISLDDNISKILSELRPHISKQESRVVYKVVSSILKMKELESL